uniref:Ionotropic glutamate receptor C-terminal domain-containing protein n=1 Tax=Strigamia maritima TaxID=126957 RepID=T1IJ49_STRMM
MKNSEIGIFITFITIFTYSSSYTSTKEKHFTIAAIFENEDMEELEAALRHAVERSNIEPWFRPRTRLLWESASILKGDMCHLIKSGINAVLGPTTRAPSWQAHSTCSALQIPHISLHEDFRRHKNETGVNIYPAPSAIAQTVAALVNNWEWFDEFIILYEDQEGLIRVQELLKLRHKSFQIYRLEPGKDPSPMFKKIMKAGTIRFVIDAEIKTIVFLFDRLQSLGMLTEYHDYIIINYDLHTLDLSKFRQPVINITGFQIIDPTTENYRDILNRWRLRSNDPDILNMDIASPEQSITTRAALVYDAILLYASAVTMYDIKDLNKSPATCEYYGLPNRKNWKFLNGIRKLNVTGLTGPVFFNREGFRSSLNIHVVKNIATGLLRINTWNAESGLFPALDPDELRAILEATIVQRRHLIVTSFLNPPLLMKKETDNGKVEYEGYVMDLVNNIHEIYPQLNFTVRPVLDDKYGDNQTGKWNGMVGELIERKADVAIADLAITRERQDAVDFTIPFMHLGIGILFKKAPSKPPKLFAFLNPFSEDVWIFMATAVLGVSLMLFFLARVSPYEWINPPPYDSDFDELVINRFNLMDSLWFVIASLIKLGREDLPKAISTRTVASAWWFFTLIVVATYTATLAAFITSDRMTQEISTVEQLAGQTKVKYGCVRGGATFNFFYKSKTPVYESMFRLMESADPSIYVNNNADGIQRVQNGDYAFFMENVFIEYQTERNCKLVAIGNPLDNKGYGIAMPKNSPYFPFINHAVLRLQDNTRLTQLKTRWWQEKGLEEPCPADPSIADKDKMNIKDIGGVFLVLGSGTLFACLVGVVEFMWFTHKNVRLNTPSMWRAMFKQLKFAVWGGNAKPIDKSSYSESETGLAMINYSSALFGRDTVIS